MVRRRLPLRRLEREVATRRVDIPLRGEAKLRAALAAFSIDVAGRVALDSGAAAGGFTRVVLAAGARRVYALDAGHGRLRGSIRADPRVVTMERTNMGRLDAGLVPDPVDVLTSTWRTFRSRWRLLSSAACGSRRMPTWSRS